MKIAVIDSGIDTSVVRDIPVTQFRVFNDEIQQESPYDYLGHGTVVASAALSNISESNKKNIEIVAICLNSNLATGVDDTIEADDMALAIEFAIEQGCKIINISMNCEEFNKRKRIDNACFKAREQGIIILCAKSNRQVPTLPWACMDVIKVNVATDDLEEFDGPYKVVNYPDYKEIVLKYKTYTAKSPKNKVKLRVAGTSFACGELSGIFANLILNNRDLCFIKDYYANSSIHPVKCGFCFNVPKFAIHKAVVISYSKEMHTLIRFMNQLPYDIVGVVDTPLKGTQGRDAGELMGISNVGIQISGSLRDVLCEYDTIIIGYLDKLEIVDDNYSIDSILQLNIECNRANVYSLVPISQEWHEKYAELNIHIDSAPIVNIAEYEKVIDAIPYDYINQKPVIGIFATNSEMGKFTFQFLLKEKFIELGKKVFHFSTEHQGYLVGADAVLPDGYSQSTNISIDITKKTEYIKRIMVYADKNTDSDLIIVGNQGTIIPPNLYTWSPLITVGFLEGTKPDFSILIIDPYFNDEEYVRDSIDMLRSLFKCRTLYLAFPDRISYINKFGKLRKRKIDENDVKEIKKYIKDKYGYDSGCILHEEFISKVANKIISICE